MANIIIKRGKSKPFFKGEPLVFSGAIQKVVGNPLPADLVSVYSADNKLIGVGAFNPYSNYRVRLIAFAHENLPPQLPEIISYRLKFAIERRKKLGLPSDATNTYRLFNSEADGLSGLTIDIFAEYAVVSVTAYWLMLYREVLLNCLQMLNFKNIIWRAQEKVLAQDGWREKPPEEKSTGIVTVKENTIQYEVDLDNGQKTGFYCDQRDNRLLVRSLAKDRDVLDCYCYTGGFALNAALGGAKTVIGIDSSKPAIHQAIKNAELNHLKNVRFEVSKVEDFLLTEPKADFIILDPPKLAPTQASLQRAKQHYLKLNRLAMSLLPENGLLLTCSCSNAMTEKIFLSILESAATKLGKQIEILEKNFAAPDHPFLEKSQYGNYLKAFLIRLH